VRRALPFIFLLLCACGGDSLSPAYFLPGLYLEGEGSNWMVQVNLDQTGVLIIPGEGCYPVTCRGSGTDVVVIFMDGKKERVWNPLLVSSHLGYSVTEVEVDGSAKG
jgi:hypothetical protein